LTFLYPARVTHCAGRRAIITSNPVVVEKNVLPKNVDKCILGLRGRRGHDLRRTFITLAQVDGARRDLLKVMTHGPAADDIINLYTTFPWPALCAEVEKLKVDLARARPEPAAAPSPIDRPDNVVPLFRTAAPKSINPIEQRVAGDCSATCSADFPSAFEPLPRFERGTYGLRNRCSTTEL
jgi:hypothetical protein